MKVLETNRLLLRRLTVDDSVFILELLNEPSFIQNIGDRGVRTIEGASRYILRGAVDSYERFGFGLYLVELKETGTSIGICGLIKRESLKDVDIGFAFLQKFWSKGYALESSTAVLSYAKDTLGLKRIVAITSPGNVPSIRVLEKLGLRFEDHVKLSHSDSECKLFAIDSQNSPDPALKLNSF